MTTLSVMGNLLVCVRGREPGMRCPDRLGDAGKALAPPFGFSSCSLAVSSGPGRVMRTSCLRPFGPAHSYKPFARIRPRRFQKALRKLGLTATVSARALIRRLPVVVSLARKGTSPRCKRSSQFSSSRRTTHSTSWDGAKAYLRLCPTPYPVESLMTTGCSVKRPVAEYPWGRGPV